jgi:hypothetical protein
MLGIVSLLLVGIMLAGCSKGADQSDVSGPCQVSEIASYPWQPLASDPKAMPLYFDRDDIFLLSSQGTVTEVIKYSLKERKFSSQFKTDTHVFIDAFISGFAVIDANTYFVANQVTCRSRETGQIRWLKESDGFGFDPHIAVFGRRAVVTQHDVRVVVLDAQDGHVLKRIPNARVCIASDGAVYAIHNFSGMEYDQLRVENLDVKALFAYTNVPETFGQQCTVIPDKPELVVGIMFRAGLSVVDTKQGKLLWRVSLAPLNNAAMEKESYLLCDEIVCQNDRIVTLIAPGKALGAWSYDGTLCWVKGFKGDNYTARKMIGNHLVLGTESGKILWLNIQDGAVVHSIQLQDSPISAIASQEDKPEMVVLNKAGKIYMVTKHPDQATCK